MANSFSHIGVACVRVLARQAAINLVKSELARQGLRVHSVPMRDIQIAADDYLAAHPELIEDAHARAWRIAVNDPRSQIGRACQPVELAHYQGIAFAQRSNRFSKLWPVAIRTTDLLCEDACATGSV